MADGIITPCNVARSWLWFRQVTAPCNVACGSRIVTVNSPSGSTLQCDTWLWDDMPLNSPVSAPCNVTRSSGIMTFNSPGGSTLQCGRWLWDDMPWNSPKRPPHWNSTSGLDFDHITAVVMSFFTSLQHFYPNRTTLSRKIYVMSNNGFYEKPMHDFLQVVNKQHSSKLLSFRENGIFAFWRQDPIWRISAILDFRGPIIVFFEKLLYDFL